MPRLFVAIDLPNAVKGALIALKTEIEGAKWVKAENMHLTLRFIGEVDAAGGRLTPIKDALATVKGEAFDMTLASVGRFPEGTKKPPRVLWVGIESPPALVRLYQSIEAALKGIGFAPDDRGFSAHITLARIDGRSRNAPPQARSSAFERFLERHVDYRSEPIHVSSFILVNSTLTPQGSIYRREAVVVLREESTE